MSEFNASSEGPRRPGPGSGPSAPVGAPAETKPGMRDVVAAENRRAAMLADARHDPIAGAVEDGGLASPTHRVRRDLAVRTDGHAGSTDGCGRLERPQ